MSRACPRCCWRAVPTTCVQLAHHDVPVTPVQREEPHFEVGQDHVAAMDVLHVIAIDHELDKDVHLVCQPGRGVSTSGDEVG